MSAVQTLRNLRVWMPNDVAKQTFDDALGDLEQAEARIQELEAERASYMGAYHANRVKELEARERDYYDPELRARTQLADKAEAERDRLQQTNADLLAALERCEERLFPFKEKVRGQHGILDALADAWKDVHAAIAKAKGEA